MKAKQVGFTLIELLVVVLIVTVLAAVAVPQYQKAIERSRLAEAIQVLEDWISAERIHYLQTSQYATSWEELNEGDIHMKDPSKEGGWTYSMTGVPSQMASLQATRNSGRYQDTDLIVKIFSDTSISKSCYFYFTNDAMLEYCDMAAPAGYGRQIKNPNTSPGGAGTGGVGTDPGFGPTTPGGGTVLILDGDDSGSGSSGSGTETGTGTGSGSGSSGSGTGTGSGSGSSGSGTGSGSTPGWGPSTPTKPGGGFGTITL